MKIEGLSQVVEFRTHLRQFLPIALLLGCLVLLLSACQAPPSPSGPFVRVERVISGQTLEILGLKDENTTQRVRLIGIEAPDLEQQPWGFQAQARLEELIGSKSRSTFAEPLPLVMLETDLEEQDSRDRKLAYVWQNGVLLNEQLVAEGLALVSPQAPNAKYDQRLMHAQEKARLLGLGIWNPENPMRQTPSEFRNQEE
ncbi:MAG: thermonuclease family protein [Leptolyngbyaceae cyanobacterium bins.59]|nr:thermonuclease family protein [Leptolyngbyaceae cyanobacterium bins.59]